MRVTVLGSGTSSGVPLVGCGCPVCTSDDPRNQRTRASVAIELPGGTVLIDTSTDLRAQALRHGLSRVDAVLYTHAHADHLHGVDDLRPFCRGREEPLPCFASPDTLDRLRTYLAYIFDPDGEPESWRPLLGLREVQGPFELLGQEVMPVPLWHGRTLVLGYRLGGFAYLTDANRIPEGSWPLLEGLELLMLDALRPKPHPTHFSLEEAAGVIARLAPARAVLTHLAHQVDHAAVSAGLPRGVSLAHDGLVLEVGSGRPVEGARGARGGPGPE